MESQHFLRSTLPGTVPIHRMLKNTGGELRLSKLKYVYVYKKRSSQLLIVKENLQLYRGKGLSRTIQMCLPRSPNSD